MIRTSIREEGGIYRLFIRSGGSPFHRVSFVDMTRQTTRADATRVLRQAYRQVKATMPSDAVYYVLDSGPSLIWAMNIDAR